MVNWIYNKGYRKTVKQGYSELLNDLQKAERVEQERVWAIINKRYRDVVCEGCGIEFTTDENRRVCMGCFVKS